MAAEWPVRLVVVGDFSGGRHDARKHSVVGRPPNDLMSVLAPQVTLDGGIDFAPRHLDDFSPARLRAVLSEAGKDQTPENLDEALHSPSLQRIESAWRGLALLLAAAGEQETVDVVDVDMDRLRRDPDAVLGLIPASTDEYPTAALLDLELGSTLGDQELARSLARFAERIRIPVVTGVSPSMFGLRHAAHVAALSEPATQLLSAWGGQWANFLHEESARWLVLTLNRFLLRSPYTPEVGDHAEIVSPGRPSDYLWGRGMWLVGVDLLRSAQSQGHPLNLSGYDPTRYHADLGVWSWRSQDGTETETSIEAPLRVGLVTELLGVGITPLVEPTGKGSAILPLVANAYRPRVGRLPVEATAAHTILAGRLALGLAIGVADAAAEADNERARARLEDTLTSIFGSVFQGQEGPSLAVQVDAVGGQRTATIGVSGPLPGTDRAFEIEVSVPFGKGG